MEGVVASVVDILHDEMFGQYWPCYHQGQARTSGQHFSSFQ